MSAFADKDELERAEFDKHRARFFAMIGHCVTLYQTIEDYLPDVFAAALGGDEARANAIFAVVRGLEAKIDVISAALLGREADGGQYWPDLRRRIGKAAKARNEIAHATPLTNGGRTVITIDMERREAVRAEQVEKARMELRKQTRSGETVWTMDQMLAEYRRCEALFSNLITMVKLLRNENVPPHLLDSLSSYGAA